MISTHLLESSKTTWETDESTRTLSHLHLAFVHRVYNNLSSSLAHSQLTHSGDQDNARFVPVVKQGQKYMAYHMTLYLLTDSRPCSLGITPRPYAGSPFVCSFSPPAATIGYGITPVTRPPFFKAAPDTTPIRPFDPPPYTSGRSASAKALPKPFK